MRDFPLQPEPFTVARYVREEIELRRREPQGGAVYFTAMQEAEWALTREPNPQVCACYAVARSLDRYQRHPFDDAVPCCFVGGRPYRSRTNLFTKAHVFADWDDNWRCIPQPDLNSVASLTPQWTALETSRTLTATWKPDYPNVAITADPMRPPVEALALVGSALTAAPNEGTGTEPWSLGFDAEYALTLPAVCTFGLGYAAAVQALSAMQPSFRIYGQPAPYELREQPRRRWHATVVNLPSAHAWSVAQMLTNPDSMLMPFLRRKAVLRGKHLFATNHLEFLVREAIHQSRGGAMLCLLGDPEPYHKGLKLLRPLLQPKVVAGIDTSDRPIWVGYDKRPWAPFGIPRPTGKLLSFWRWAR